jgi:hypothetical protein
LPAVIGALAWLVGDPQQGFKQMADMINMSRLSNGMRAEIFFSRPGSMQLTTSTANVSTKYAERLREIEGVADALPVIRYVTQVKRGFGFELVEGVDWASYATMNEIHIVAARPPEAADEYVIDEVKAQADQIGVGSRVDLFGDKPYRVVGIYAPASGSRTKMEYGDVSDTKRLRPRCALIECACAWYHAGNIEHPKYRIFPSRTRSVSTSSVSSRSVSRSGRWI